MLFHHAGLDPETFVPADFMWIPPVYSDTLAAWAGHYPSRPDIEIRVEAAAYRGKPTHFRIIEPWTRPERMAPSALPGPLQVAQYISIGWLTLLLIGGIHTQLLWGTPYRTNRAT